MKRQAAKTSSWTVQLAAIDQLLTFNAQNTVILKTILRVRSELRVLPEHGLEYFLFRRQTRGLLAETLSTTQALSEMFEKNEPAQDVNIKGMDGKPLDLDYLQRQIREVRSNLQELVMWAQEELRDDKFKVVIEPHHFQRTSSSEDLFTAVETVLNELTTRVVGLSRAAAQLTKEIADAPLLIETSRSTAHAAGSLTLWWPMHKRDS